jgi:hypothetical protein
MSRKNTTFAIGIGYWTLVLAIGHRYWQRESTALEKTLQATQLSQARDGGGPK